MYKQEEQERGEEEVRLEEFICNLRNTEHLRYFKIQAKRKILLPLFRANKKNDVMYIVLSATGNKHREGKLMT